MNKKVFSLMILTVLLFTVSGCGDWNNTGDGNGKIRPPARDYKVYASYFPNSGTQNPDKAYDWNLDTEWGRVSRAISRFEGQILPEPLWGYENHSDPEVMAKVIDAASSYGVDGFMFDWYWYQEIKDGGKANGLYLEMELENGFLKAENRASLDFGIYWCNHDGPNNNKAVFPRGTSEFEFMTDYILEKYMSRENYIRIEGKPIFEILDLTAFVEIFKNQYGATDIRLAKAALDKFRQKSIDAGCGNLYIGCFLNRASGVDASAAWPGGIPPAGWNVFEYLGLDYVTNLSVGTSEKGKMYDLDPRGWVIDYAVYWQEYGEKIEQWILDQKDKNAVFVPHAQVGYDPTARISPYIAWGEGTSYADKSSVLHNNTPEEVKNHLYNVRDLLDKYDLDIVRIGSWNEWAEGAFIEPSREYGYGYLRAIKEVFGNIK